MIKINIISNYKSWNKYTQNSEYFLRKQVKIFNKKLKKFKKKSIICTILLSDSKNLKNLNKKFIKKNKTTDILSFPFYSKNDLKKKLKSEKQIYIGDIIININRVKHEKNKKKYRFNLSKLWIHGLTHLFGYKHKTDKDYYNMLKIEKKFLSFLYNAR